MGVNEALSQVPQPDVLHSPAVLDLRRIGPCNIDIHQAIEGSRAVTSLHPASASVRSPLDYTAKSQSVHRKGLRCGGPWWRAAFTVVLCRISRIRMPGGLSSRRIETVDDCIEMLSNIAMILDGPR